MATARFYVIADDSPYASKAGYFELVNKLCSRLLSESEVSVLCDEPMLETLDAGLWAHPLSGFTPHQIKHSSSSIETSGDKPATPPSTFSITFKPDTIQAQAAVINLTQLPLDQSNLGNLVELVRPNGPSKERARRHFKAYKRAGFELKHFYI